jgi:C-terminal processing protease CtpA/Prc
MTVGLTAVAELFQVGNIGVGITETRSGGEAARIIEVFPGSPAEIAGVKTNWFIISIDGTNVMGAASQRCMGMLHGTVGTSVRLELADPKWRQTNSFVIKRENVRMPKGPTSFATNAPYF